MKAGNETHGAPHLSRRTYFNAPFSLSRQPTSHQRGPFPSLPGPLSYLRFLPLLLSSPQVLSSLSSPLPALPYQPFYFYHFIGNFYILQVQWVWTKTLSHFVRYMRWNTAHNLYFPLLLLSVFLSGYLVPFSSSLTFVLYPFITYYSFSPFSSLDYFFFP